MVTKENDVKKVIKELITEGLGKVKSRTICRDGLEIRMTRTDDETIRFDLPDQNRCYALMSGRLYERKYNKCDTETDKTKGEPETHKSLPQRKEPAPVEEQLNYRGEVERVDTRIFKNRITCECGNVRWIKSSDRFQVRHCKPCAQRKRRERRKIKQVVS